MNTNLLTEDGFPRADLDIAQSTVAYSTSSLGDLFS